jgi:hypothetical protein
MAPGMCINRLSQGDFRTYKQKFPLKILENSRRQKQKSRPWMSHLYGASGAGFFSSGYGFS